MNSFIKASEIWAPDMHSPTLRLVRGDYGDLDMFQSLSKETVFHYGEGLPGKAWSEARPILLSKLDDSCFKRVNEAKVSGISCAIAYPIFAGHYLLAVLVFLCSDSEEVEGAVELWHCDREESYDLKLQDGYFGRLNHFEFLSRHTSFRRGVGLPGAVWESGMPKLLSDLGASHRFVRSRGAQKAGITTGLGIPFFFNPKHTYVMTFLSALGTPIAKQIELWTPTYDYSGLLFARGSAPSNYDLTSQYNGVKLNIGDGIIGHTLLTGLPNICTDVDRIQTEQNVSAKEFGYEKLVTFPILENGWCKCVIALYN